MSPVVWLSCVVGVWCDGTINVTSGKHIGQELNLDYLYTNTKHQVPDCLSPVCTFLPLKVFLESIKLSKHFQIC